MTGLAPRGLPYRASCAACRAALERLARTMAVELAAAAAAFLTGQTPLVDGGASLGRPS